MKKICVGICDRDSLYGRRMMEYLNHQEEYPMKAVCFSNVKELEEYRKTGTLHCLILAQGLKGPGDVPVLFLGDVSGQGMKRFGSIRSIAKEIYQMLNISQESYAAMTAVYAPFCEEAGLLYAKKFNDRNGTYLFAMETYQSFGTSKTAMEDLLFGIKERKSNIVDIFLKQSVEELEPGCFGISGAGCFLDYHGMLLEDYQWFYKEMEKSRVFLTTFIGTGCLVDPDLFQSFDRVLILLEEKERDTQKYRSFQNMMKRHGTLPDLKLEEVLSCK